MKFYLVLYTALQHPAIGTIPEIFETKMACEQRAMSFEGFRHLCLTGDDETSSEFVKRCKIEARRITCPGSTVEF